VAGTAANSNASATHMALMRLSHGPRDDPTAAPPLAY
jgi:hypothetical protein